MKTTRNLTRCSPKIWALGSKQWISFFISFFPGLILLFQQRVESLEEEIDNLKQQNAGLRRDDEYRAMSFDDCMCYSHCPTHSHDINSATVCVRARTSDERVAIAHQCRTMMENTLKAELNTGEAPAKSISRHA
jgi:hypothetical protein